MQVAAPRPLPMEGCGVPPVPVGTASASTFEGTTVALPPPVACRGAPGAGTAAQIRGVAGVVAVPWGLVSLGGAELCVMRGARRWERLHEVPGDNLYRVAADASGRVLAYWEKDPDIHLFVPAKKQHVRIRRPVAPYPTIFEWGVSNLFFSEDGRTAVVLMEDRPARPPTTHAAYLLDLENAVPPRILFVQTGLLLHGSVSASVFAVPKNPTSACFDLGCWPIAEIRAWEVTRGAATCKTLLSGNGDQLERARAMPGSDDDQQVGVLIADRSRNRGILRWRYGEARADYRPLPPPSGPDWAADASRLTRAGDLLELWTTNAWGLLVLRHLPTGETRSIQLPPLPRRQGLTDTEGVHLVKERTSDDLFVHWGDYLLLLPATGPTRLMNLEAVPGGREWAWVDVYVPQPEALWIGVEGAGREFYRLPFSEIEHGAKPWPTDPAQVR
jgi:hypothetical protein